MEESNLVIRRVKMNLRGVALDKLNRTDEARSSFETAARIYEEALADSPTDDSDHARLGLIYAWLGRADEAIQEAKLAVELASKDRFSGPKRLEDLAEVYTIVGRFDEAIDLIDRLLDMQYESPLTVHALRLNHVWDPLRELPEFRALLEKHGGAS